MQPFRNFRRPWTRRRGLGRSGIILGRLFVCLRPASLRHRHRAVLIESDCACRASVIVKAHCSGAKCINGANAVRMVMRLVRRRCRKIWQTAITAYMIGRFVPAHQTPPMLLPLASTTMVEEVTSHPVQAARIYNEEK